MKKAARDLYPHKHEMVCQNTLFAILKSLSNLSPNFFQALSSDSCTFVATALRASKCCERNSTYHLFASQALWATFFTQMTFLISWFYQGVLFSLLFVSPTRLRPQQLVMDVMTAAQNKHHSVSMSSVAVGSSLNVDAMLSVNAVRTSLSANDSHLIG